MKISDTRIQFRVKAPWGLILRAFSPHAVGVMRLLSTPIYSDFDGRLTLFTLAGGQLALSYLMDLRLFRSQMRKNIFKFVQPFISADRLIYIVCPARLTENLVCNYTCSRGIFILIIKN